MAPSRYRICGKRSEEDPKDYLLRYHGTHDLGSDGMDTMALVRFLHCSRCCPLDEKVLPIKSKIAVASSFILR